MGFNPKPLENHYASGHFFCNHFQLIHLSGPAIHYGSQRNFSERHDADIYCFIFMDPIQGQDNPFADMRSDHFIFRVIMDHFQWQS